MRIKILFTFLIGFLSYTITAQDDLSQLKKALTAETPIAEDLQELCDEIGGRVTGSMANQLSVEWALQKFQEAGVNARKEAFEMPVLWLEEACTADINTETGGFDLNIVSKYRSPSGQYKGELIYLDSLGPSYLESMKNLIKDNFILVSTDLCMDIDGLFAEYIVATNTENAAAKYGAQGIVFMSSRPQKLLYRFITSKGTDNHIPQFVIAREDANRCIRLIKAGAQLEFNATIDAEEGQSFTSHNVIAEFTGSEKPEEVIVLGAHLDSWALGTGANDNGCNVSMLIDIARQMKKLNIQPKRTIRLALWNGEEQGFFGSWAYTKTHRAELDNHILAISIDIGSGDIIGFFTNGREALIPIVDKALTDASEFGPFNQINVPIVGTDNFDFMLEGVPNLVGVHKPQVYGYNYHAASDTYNKVDINSLKNNAAIVASLILNIANSNVKLPRHSRVEIEKMFDKANIEFSMRMFNVWEPWVEGTRGRKK